jgi:SPX domain protein involved in polyphosphate accumulation
MKFGKTLREQIIQEWRFYAVDYKALKKTLSMKSDESANVDAFYDLLNDSKNKLSKFYFDKEAWANDYMHTLEERVHSLRETCSDPACGRREVVTSRSDASLSSSCSDMSESSTEPTETSPKGTMDLALKM